MARVQLWVIAVFILFKLIRTSALENNPHEYIQILLLSFPNLCEAIIGVMTVTMIGLYLSKKMKISKETIYITATILAAIYVITQEMKFHNLGGNNIYDPNDVIFSIIGLVVGYVIVYQMKPNLQMDSTLK